LHKGSQHTAKSEDPTGLYYFGARYHDPATGRFTTRDTMFDALEHRTRGVQKPRIISLLGGTMID
jgi:RHS repeat-associated protein